MRASLPGLARVPRFQPFAGIRYAPSARLSAVVTSPPYDVIDAAERAALAASHPANAVHVDCPVGDLGAGAAGDAGAARPLRRRRRDVPRGGGPTAPSSSTTAPSFTVYRMSLHRRSRRAPVHHRRASAPSPRAYRARATCSPTSARRRRRSPTGSTCCGRRTPTSRRSGACPSPTGCRSCSSRPGDAARRRRRRRRRPPPGLAGRRPEAVCAAIADAVGSRAGRHRRRSPPLRDLPRLPRRGRRRLPGADATLFLVVELVAEQLTVRPIHRLLSGLPDGFDVLAALDADL